MANTNYQLTLHDYVMMVRRRFWLMAAIFIVVFAASLGVAVYLPPVYQSTGTVLVESQQIPVDLVPSTITTQAEERIQVIRARVMTRENLLRIIERHNLFADEAESMTVSDKLAIMRNRIRIEVIRAEGGSRRGGGAIAFRLSFEDRSPAVAHRVANDLVTLFLSENVRVRTERATETTQFLAREAEKLRLELESLEAQVAQYKQQHADALPEHLNMRLGMLQRAEASLAALDRDYKSVEEEKRFLELELAAIQAGIKSAATSQAASPAFELARLREEYAALRARYTEFHPDVRALAGRIETLEQMLPEGDAALDGAAMSATEFMAAQVQGRLEAADRRLASIAAQQDRLKQQIEELEAQILQTPQVERALFMLTRDYDNARRKYDDLRAKQVQAQLAESLEEESRAERFSLLEPPQLPDSPIKPDRQKIAMMGFMLAGALGGGIGLALEFLNQKVRGARALAAIVRQQPLVVIPYIRTSYEAKQQRRRLLIAGAGSVLFAMLAASLIHVFYQPLNILFFKVLARLT